MLRKFLSDNAISQAAVAQAVGISQGRISQICAGSMLPGRLAGEIASVLRRMTGASRRKLNVDTLFKLDRAHYRVRESKRR